MFVFRVDVSEITPTSAISSIPDELKLKVVLLFVLLTETFSGKFMLVRCVPSGSWFDPLGSVEVMMLFCEFNEISTVIVVLAVRAICFAFLSVCEISCFADFISDRAKVLVIAGATMESRMLMIVIVNISSKSVNPELVFDE